MHTRIPAAILVLATLLGLSGCAHRQSNPTRTMHGESLVFVGEEPAALAYPVLNGTPIAVRSTYQSGSGTVEYTQGRDYAIDRSSGTLRRLPGSRIPDFRTNSLYGQESFDHSKFPGFGNTGFFTFVDYPFRTIQQWPIQPPQMALLPKSRAKLQSGGDFKIVAFGDSITAGGDATRPEWIFWERYAAELQQKYPQARITAVNGATGGDSTVQGLARLEAKVLSQKPDLVLIGFGMNDHNIGGVPIPQFESNLKEMISRIRSQTGAEIGLFSTFPPNPKWKYGSHRMEQYAAATARVAQDSQCAYADVFTNWQSLAARKKPEDLLGNDINHPNDFGHWIYFAVLRAMEL